MNSPNEFNAHYRDPFLENLEPEFLVGAGRYTLRRIIGLGIFSAVWVAWDNRLNEEVSLKLYSTSFISNTEAFNELRLAVQKARKLSHPNIVRINEFYSAPGEVAFVPMEYFDGTELGRLRMDRPGQVFSWAELKPLLIQACGALHYAHSEGLAHGNLKPSNMLLDRRGRLKLADFGLPIPPAKLMKELSGAEYQSSDLPWMSPQRIDRAAPGVQDDVYSFGAVIYGLVTGSPIFYLGDIQHQVRNVRPPPLAERLNELGVENEIPPEVQDLVFACLAKEESERPADFGVVAQRLNQPQHSVPGPGTTALVYEPISLIPPSKEKLNRAEGQRAVEEAKAFESSLAEMGNEGTEADDASPENAANRVSPTKIAAIAAGMLVLTLIVSWIVNQQRRDTKKAKQLVENTSPASLVSEQSLNRTGLPDEAAETVKLPNGTYVGKGPAFSYHYAPRETLALDTNAVNVGVRFRREGPQAANCSYIMTAGKTNNSFGTITYHFRAAPGYLIEDMSLSQSAALFTSGRVRGVYSADGGKTFSEFYLTPPYQGKSFGFRKTATLYSLKAPSVLIRYIIHRYRGNDLDLQFLRDCDDGTETLEISGSVIPQSAGISVQ